MASSWNGNIKAKAEIHSYEDAKNFLGDASRRDVASNVEIVARAKGIAVKLYATDVVIYYPDGTFSVDNGGWNTPTTSARIRQFTPKWFYVWHHKMKLHGNAGKEPLSHEVKIGVGR